jgi:hypothetical protein
MGATQVVYKLNKYLGTKDGDGYVLSTQKSWQDTGNTRVDTGLGLRRVKTLRPVLDGVVLLMRKGREIVS